MKHVQRAIVLGLLCAALLPALAAPPLSPALADAEERYADGDYAAAAQALLLAAMTAAPADRNTLLIRAGEAALRGERRDLAARAAHNVDTSRLTLNQRIRLDLLLAELGELPGGPSVWLERLPPPGKDADAALAERLLAARADAYLRQGDVVGAVRTLVQRESWLSDEDASRNQARIWSALRTAPATGTQFQSRAELDTITRGWLELAMLQRAAWTDSAERDESLDGW